MTETILNKIRRLLELSKSSNEHEAALAAARATELMLKHQIAEADLQTPESKPDPIIEEALDQRGKWVSWKGWIAMGLADAFGCETYRTTVSYCPKREEHRIIGPESVMPTVRYMYSYLTAEIARLADEGYKVECDERIKSNLGNWLPPARQWKASFRAGAASTIANRLRAQRAETFKTARQEHSQALMVINKQHDAIIERAKFSAPWNFTKSGKPRSSSSTYSPSSSDGYSAGRSAGSSVSLGGGKQIGAGQKRLS